MTIIELYIELVPYAIYLWSSFLLWIVWKTCTDKETLGYYLGAIYCLPIIIIVKILNYKLVK